MISDLSEFTGQNHKKLKSRKEVRIKKTVMSIVIFGDNFSFPEGDAATNRVYNYARGFYENGINVHVICFSSEYNTIGDGMMNEIHFYHPFGIRNRSKFFIVRRWQKFIKYFRTFSLIRTIQSKDKIIAVHCYTQLLQTQLFSFVISRYCKAILTLERSEHPMRNTEGKVIKRIHGNFKIAIETRLYDGIFCISDYLIRFYHNKGCNKRKLFLVPSTVDPARFSNALDSPFRFKYILYCGSLTTLKDGVDILIESFSRISMKHPDINLALVGEADTLKDEIFFRELVSRFNIKNRVFFTGKLPRTAIPAYMYNAEILTLARPRSIVADAGFPSKLTEYLATGKPVVVTRVGEIPVYLKDNENAFLSEPDSVDAFTDKLDYVLCNYQLAKKIGESGRELTYGIFNYNHQASRIINFLSKGLA